MAARCIFINPGRDRGMRPKRVAGLLAARTKQKEGQKKVFSKMFG